MEHETQELLEIAEPLMKRYRKATKLSDLSEEDRDHWMILQTEFSGILETGAVEYVSDVTKARIELFKKWAESIPDGTDDFILTDQATLAITDIMNMTDEETKDYLKALDKEMEEDQWDQ